MDRVAETAGKAFCEALPISGAEVVFVRRTRPFRQALPYHVASGQRAARVIDERQI